MNYLITSMDDVFTNLQLIVKIIDTRIIGSLQFKHHNDRDKRNNNVVKLSGQLLSQLGLLDTRGRPIPITHRVPV